MAAATSLRSPVTRMAYSGLLIFSSAASITTTTTTTSTTTTTAATTTCKSCSGNGITIKRAELEDDEAVRTIFQVLNRCRCQTKEPLAQSLSSMGILLTNTVIERVLLRCRFSHSSPHAAFLLYHLTSLRRGFFHSPLSLETLLYILGRSRLFPLCLHVLRRSHPSLVTPRALHVLLSRVAKSCSLRQTIRTFLLCTPLCNSDHPPASAFNALLRALAQERSMRDARRAYHLLKRRFPPDLATFNTLLSGWSSPDDARAFFQEMLDLGVSPDLVSFNCLIQCHCRSREVDEALELVQQMRDRGIDPDVITYTSLIGGLGLAGRPDAARELLNEMREYGCYPDTAAYNAAIRNFCIARRLKVSFTLVEEMKEKAGLRPNATTFNLFFRCFYWANEWKGAWELYRRMREVERCLPNTQTCMFLMRLFRRHERVDMALRLWEDMVGEGFGSLPLVSDVLFDLLCDVGKVVEAERCFLQMVDKGHRPSHASFKRIKVLMELAMMHESIKNLSEKMVSFENHASWSARSLISERDIEESTRKWQAA